MRLPIIALAFLTGFSSSSAGEPIVVLESGAYGCGAAPGIGCGLAVAPLLATIDGLDGVMESRVSWDGRYFEIGLEPGADADRVAAAAAAVLGEGMVRVSATDPDVDAAGVRWLNSAETIALSRNEAGVLAADFTADIVKEVALDGSAGERLGSVLRQELEGGFERAPAAGGTVDRLWEQFPEVRSRFEARIAEFLSPEQCSQVSAVLDRELGE